MLVNMGGPSNTDEIKPYLKSIFRDPAILPLPGIIRTPLASIIAHKRKDKVAERYDKIGGSSPLIVWTEKLRDSINKIVDKNYDDITVAHAFRYTSPSIEDALEAFSALSIKRVRLLPLFPHKTSAMTGSIEDEARRVAGKLGMVLSMIPAWGNHSEILSIWAAYIKELLGDKPDDSHLLFVAHGIPRRDVRRGDDYPENVEKTARTLGRWLPDNITWSLAYQSKVGPVKWTGPYLENEIDKLAAKGARIILMPISFAADCLETLYDLDIAASDRAMKTGARSVSRVRVFNDDDRFARAMVRIALEGRQHD